MTNDRYDNAPNGDFENGSAPKSYESKEFYKRAIENDKMNLDSAFSDYRAAIKTLKVEYKEYAAAKKRADKKGSAKAIAKAESAANRYDSAVMDYERQRARVEKYCARIKNEYTDFVQMLGQTSHKAADKKMREAEKFETEYKKRLDKAEAPLADISLPNNENDIFENLDPIEAPEDNFAPGEPTPAPAPAPTPAPAAPAPNPMHTVPTPPPMPDYMPPQYSAPNPYADPYAPAYYPAPDPYAAYAPRPAYAPMPEPEVHRQSVKIEPVSVDISDKVEQAVDFAMKKLSASLEKKIESYIANLVIPMPEMPVMPAPVQVPVYSGGVSAQSTEIAEKVAEDEDVIIEKLTALLAGLRKITEEYVKLNAAYVEMANKQKDISELQKQTNDMQRLTAREAQGVQVNQKVINTDQVTVAQEQAIIYETQKSVTEKQKLISESQVNMQDQQKAVIDTQAALEDAMKVVMNTQRDIIATQQAIIAGNNRNIETQKELTTLQVETANMQKEAGALQRQILRDQKAIGEKQKEAVDMQKEITDCVRDVIREQKNTVASVKKAAGK